MSEAPDNEAHEPAKAEDPAKEVPRRNGVPTGGPLLFLILAGALVAAAFLIPGEWIVKVSQLYNTPEADVDAFDASVREVDEALAAGRALPVTRAQFRSLEPHLAARRLAAAGKATAEELRDAARIYREYRSQISREESEGSKDAVRSVRNSAIAGALPRIPRDTIDSELQRLAEEVARAEFLNDASAKEGGSDAPNDDCASCHLELVDLPAGKTIDLQHLWPSLDPERLGSGPALPTLMSAAEADDCTTCHAPHDAADFGVSQQMRADNMGMWVHVRQVESVVQVQVKVQNLLAPHRVPAGTLSRAYAVTVSARRGGEPLRPWWGERLPGPVAGESSLGLFMGRTAIDRSGAFTTQPGEVVDLLDDSRLEHERFYDEYFLFAAPEEPPQSRESRESRESTGGAAAVEIVVELHYYPDWLKDESVVVQRATRSITLR